MPLLEWNDDLSIGIDLLDAEHKTFFNHINGLYEAIQFGRAPALLRPLLDELITYSIAHFAHEEEYMFATDYPERNEHKSEHESLRQKLMALQNKSEDHPTIGLSNETFAFLKEWLTHHVLTVDKKLATHLKERGMS